MVYYMYFIIVCQKRYRIKPCSFFTGIAQMGVCFNSYVAKNSAIMFIQQLP